MDTRALLDLCRSKFAATLASALGECGLRLPSVQQVIRREAEAAFDEMAELRNKEDYQRKRSVTASRISLVHPEDMDLTVALINLSNALSDACERELPRLQLLFMRLLQQQTAVVDQLPVGPDSVGIALRGLCDSGEIVPELRLNLPSLAQPRLIESLRVLYAELTALLSENGVEPASLTRSGQTPPAFRSPAAEEVFAGRPATTTSHGTGYQGRGQQEILREARSLDGPLGRLQSRLLHRQAPAAAVPSLDPALRAAIMERVLIWLTDRQQTASGEDATNLSELRALLPAHSNAALDAVGLAFDVLGSDTRLCPPARTSLARLRLPVCKAALMSESSPAIADNPPRKFLETMLRLGFCLPPQSEESHPVCQSIEAAALHIQQEFERDLEIFNTTGTTLEALEARLIDAHTESCSALQPYAQRESSREHSRHRAARAIRALCAGDVPRPIRVFLEQLWVRVLAVIHQHGGGEKSGAWLRALHTANQLVESTQPRQDTASREVLLARLPPLLIELKAGLDAIGVPENLRERAFKSFVNVHSAAINGRVLEPGPAEDILSSSPPRMEALSGQPGAFVLRLPPAAEPDRGLPEWIGQLKAGQWVDLEVPEHGWRRLRLAWVDGTPLMMLGATLDADFKLIFPARWLHRTGTPSARPIPMRSLFEQAAETAENRAAG